MKKLLALLLLAPLAYSEVYTFECKGKKIGTISSLVINTDKKFISVNGGKMHENWQENESKVGAYMYLPGGAFKHMEFNKITGRLESSFYCADGSCVESSYYTCNAAKPLMP